MEYYKAKFEKLIQRIDDLIVNGLIDENAGKAILKDFTVESEDINICLPSFDEAQGTPIIKKGEQKPTDNVEPIKIEKDKWYICIRDLDDNYGTRAFCKGRIYHSTKDETLMPDNSNIPFEIKYCVNDYFRLWTIQDAKDGNVLCYEDEVFILKNYVIFHKIVYHCCYDGKNFVPHSIYSLTKDDFNKIHPATQKQCDLLFQKMKEVGYEWDAEKKELNNIERMDALSNALSLAKSCDEKAFMTLKHYTNI